MEIFKLTVSVLDSSKAASNGVSDGDGIGYFVVLDLMSYYFELIRHDDFSYYYSMKIRMFLFCWEHSILFIIGY